MMPPRLSARRLCFVVLFFASVTLFISLTNNRLPWPPRKPDLSAESKQDDQQLQNLQKLQPIENSIGEEDVVVDDGEEPTKKPGKLWFLAGGTEYPGNHKGPPRLFPDQADGDRVVDQLMYVPETYQGKYGKLPTYL